MSNQPNVDHTVDELPGEERGMPSVNDTRPSTAKRGLIVSRKICRSLTRCQNGHSKSRQR
jgi:hypothetical protein